MASKTDLKKDYYSLLGVERNASKESILKAFRQRARLFHPDKNPGHEDLMKLLTTAKITLIDPEKRAYYDDTYAPDNDDIPEGEKIFLNMGKRLSQSFIEKIEIWLKEFDSLEIKDNFEVIYRKYNELKEALAEICEEIPNEDFLTNSFSKYFKLLNNSKKNSSLSEKFAHQMPDQIWSMTGVNSNRILFKQIFIKTFGDWKNSGDEFFAQDHYKTALFCYKQDFCNEVILKKAHQLYEKKKYEISLLYFRHLFDFDEYKPISSLMMINILQNLEKDIFDVALHSAYEFRSEAELHRIVSKQLFKKDMIFEAKDALDIAIQLRSDIEKDVTSEHKDLERKCEQKYYNDLRALVYEFEIQKIAIYIKENSNYAVIDKLYTELTKGQNISELQPKYRAILSILKGAFLQLGNKYDESFECFRDALLLYPFEDTVSAVSILMDDYYIKPSGQQLLYQIKSSQIEFPAVHEYAGMLRSSPLLRTVIKYEKSVQNQKISDFEKAMLYIDLSMACGHPCLMANNFLIAANFLINAMKTEDNLATKYAFRNTVCDLCANVLFLANNYMDPVSVTYFVKMSLILMNSSHEILKLSFGKNKKGLVFFAKKPVNLISPLQEELLNLCNNLITRTFKANPLRDIPVTLSGDVLYLHLVGTEFLENFYNHMVNNKPSHPWNYLYHYYLHEGSWKNWANNEKFQEYRENCMNALLDRKDYTWTQIENLMSWNVINRDSDGWIDTKNLWLNLSGTQFTSIEGIVINVENGTFELLLSMDSDKPGLFNMNDVKEIFCNGITHSVFTLDQPSSELHYHPFQEMKYGPEFLKNTNYLATLLHADYLLKMFTMGTEVSSKKPFLFREGENGFLAVLPEFLREALTSTSRLKSSNDLGKVHRFWIEAKDLPYTQTEKGDNKIMFTFGYCPMIVKKHLMKYDSEGELVDDEDSEDDDEDDNEEEVFPSNKIDKEKKKMTPEKKFAKNFSRFYEEIGLYYPVFLRLRELLKLGAISIILKSIYMNLKSSIETVVVETEPIRRALREFRGQIEYPLNTNSKVNEIFSQTLRENGIYNESDISWSEKENLKSKIRTMLREAENKALETVAHCLCESLEINYCNNFYQYVCHWIQNNNETNLINYMANEIKNRKIEKMSKFGENLNYWGISFTEENETNLGNSGDGCVWIPAAFSQNDNCKSYGGVCLVPKLVNQNSRGQGGNAGGFGGGMGGNGDGGNRGGDICLTFLVYNAFELNF